MEAVNPNRTAPGTRAASSFDHLVGAGEQSGWDFDADRLRGLEVNDQLELGRLQDGQFGRLGTVENAARVDASLAISALTLAP
jgi:hypothetical protein